jgi:hypothetical protein
MTRGVSFQRAKPPAQLRQLLVAGSPDRATRSFLAEESGLIDAAPGSFSTLKL